MEKHVEQQLLGAKLSEAAQDLLRDIADPLDKDTTNYFIKQLRDAVTAWEQAQ